MGQRTGIVQVAFSSLDARRSHDWYAALGYRPAGVLKPTADLAAIQGVAGARVEQVLWLVDANPFFQLEIFDYSAPVTRARPADRRAGDIGYCRLTVWVDDLEAAVTRLAAVGTAPLGRPSGEQGQRRVAVLDPDGVLVELTETDPPPHPQPNRAAVATRGVTVSVPDLDRARAFFADAIGMGPADGPERYGDADEMLWGLPGAVAKRAQLEAGDLWLELVQYIDPLARPRPADYRISDQGILNIAVAGRTRAAFIELRDRVVASGARTHAEIDRERMAICYSESADGFSVELAYFDAALDAASGFSPIAT